MAKPKLKGAANIANNSFSFGRFELLNSEELGHMIYGGNIAIPRVLPESKLRIVPVAMQRSESSPDFNVECVEINADGRPYWAAGAGVAWWREKDGNPRIDLLLNIGQGQTSVNAALFPADDDQQPDDNELPEGYDEECGPVVWRVAYTPPRPSGGKPRTQAVKVEQLEDEIPY